MNNNNANITSAKYCVGVTVTVKRYDVRAHTRCPTLGHDAVCSDTDIADDGHGLELLHHRLWQCGQRCSSDGGLRQRRQILHQLRVPCQDTGAPPQIERRGLTTGPAATRRT